MEGAVILIWVGFVSLIGINGFAAGVVAILHAWRSKMRRGGRILLASFAAGALPASLIFVAMLTEAEVGVAEEPIAMMLGSAMILVLSGVLSLPGAIVVARRLERPGNEFRAFQ